MASNRKGRSVSTEGLFFYLVNNYPYNIKIEIILNNSNSEGGVNSLKGNHNQQIWL